MLSHHIWSTIAFADRWSILANLFGRTAHLTLPSNIGAVKFVWAMV